MLHCIVVLYQVCSNEGPWVKDGPAPGGSDIQTIEIIKKNQNLLLQNHFAQILKFNTKHCLVVFYQICSNGGVQNGPAPESPRFES